MNPDSPIDPRSALEASLTALLLGELPHDQAAALHQKLAQDPELAKLYERLKQTINLVRETVATPAEQAAEPLLPLRLEERRRQKLLQHLKTVAPAKFDRPRRRWRLTLVEVVVVVGLIAILTALLLPPLAKAKVKSRSLALRSFSLSKDAESAASAKPMALNTIDDFAHSQDGRMERYASRGEARRGRVPLVPRAEVAPPPPISAGAAIVLPQSTELADANTAATVTYSPPAGSPESATTRGYYDDSVVQAGGVRGGAAYGAFKAGDELLMAKKAPTGIPMPGAAVSGALPSELPSVGFGLKSSQAAGVGETARESLATADWGAAAAGAGSRKYQSTLGDVPMQGRLYRQAGEGVANGGQLKVEEKSKGMELAYPRSPAQEQPTITLNVNGISGTDQKILQLAEAKRELNEQQRFRQILDAKIAQEKIDTEIPKTAMVDIVDKAVPASASSSTWWDKIRGKPAEYQSTARVKIESDQSQLSKDSVKALEQRFAGQEQKVRETQKQVDALREERNKANTVASAASPSPVTASDAAPAKPASPPPVPQPEVQTGDNPFSTFSLNVSDVSFKLAAASLEKGVLPEVASVRSEEFVNAFDYHDPEPPAGVPVAFAWERARYPLAQNRDLLRFSIKTAARGRQPGRPLNLVLLLDNSGSMERADRVRIIREALRVLAGQLQAQDKFSVVTFSRTSRLWVDGVPGNQAAQAVAAVGGLTPQGGTNLEEAMSLAYQAAQRHYLANGINRVVLLTDGAANLGNVEPEALKQQVEANRKQGIALDCFGIGWEGYNDDLLEVLSRNGDGRYGFVNTPEEAATEFAGQLAGALRVAASDVKVQVEFNPARVTAYRQIGYAKHQLTKEQFRDNTVDAAEIGAAESGNALYVIAVNPAGDGPLATVRVRYKVPGTTDYREQAWPVPCTGNPPALEQASPALRLAATASAFSEWLAASPYAAEVTPDRLLKYLNGVPAVYGADARPGKLEWMLRQAKSISGR